MVWTGGGWRTERVSNKTNKTDKKEFETWQSAKGAPYNIRSAHESQYEHPMEGRGTSAEECHAKEVRNP